jgi:hypothetical protein
MPLASPLALAAELRRRELPATIALVVLAGGVAAAVVGGTGTVAWAAIASLLLIADLKIYQMLEASSAKLERVTAKLAAWAFLGSAVLAALPVMLWMQHGAASAAAAMVFWVAGAARCLGPGASAHTHIALAGAAPPALALLLTPLASADGDWQAALIAVLGGGALLAYLVHARLKLADAERALRAPRAEANAPIILTPNIAKPHFGAPPLQRKTG